MKEKLMGLVTLIVVGGIIASGVFNIKPIGPWVRNIYYRIKGGAQTAASSPTAPRGDLPGAKACRENLRMLESAKAKIRTTGPRATGDVSWDEVMKQLDLHGRKLLCPNGGEYIIGNMTVAARCSIGGNNTADPADDHLIKSY